MIEKIIKWINDNMKFNLFATSFANRKTTDQYRMEEWLASSTSLADIERKQQMISRGEAPWQVHANLNLRGWV